MKIMEGSMWLTCFLTRKEACKGKRIISKDETEVAGRLMDIVVEIVEFREWDKTYSPESETGGGRKLTGVWGYRQLKSCSFPVVHKGAVVFRIKQYRMLYCGYTGKTSPNRDDTWHCPLTSTVEAKEKLDLKMKLNNSFIIWSNKINKVNLIKKVESHNLKL